MKRKVLSVIAMALGMVLFLGGLNPAWVSDDLPPITNAIASLVSVTGLLLLGGGAIFFQRGRAQTPS